MNDEDVFLPLTTKEYTFNCSGVETKLYVTKYENCTFAVVTQLGTLGNLAKITQLAGQEGAAFHDCSILLGTDNPVNHLVAKRIGSSCKSSPEIFLGFALTTLDNQSVEQICQFIRQNNAA